MKFLKFFIIIGLLVLQLITLTTTNVQAALQANPKTHYKKNRLFISMDGSV